MTSRRCLAALLTIVALAGCGTEPAEQQQESAATSTTAAPTPMAAAPPDALPFKDYLETIDVFGKPVPLAGIAGLEVTVPLPPGWSRYSDPIFATGIDYVTKGDGKELYPSAQLMAIALEGEFDPRVEIEHASVDALPPRTTDAVESLQDYQGFPSLMAQGNTDDVQQYVRMVIVDVPSSQGRYLVELRVTTKLTEPIADSPELQEIIDGFTVTVT